MMHLKTARFEYFRNKRGSWKWHLRNMDGDMVAESSCDYGTIKEVKKAILLIRMYGIVAMNLKVESE